MSIELELTLFTALCICCAIGILFFGLGTANEFECKAKKMEKWAKGELDRREGEEQP